MEEKSVGNQEQILQIIMTKSSPNQRKISYSSYSSSSSSDSSPDLELCELDTPNNSQPVIVSQGPVTPSSGVPGKTSFAGKRSGLLLQPPLFQMMDNPGSYDPNRIPAAVFASRPATPIEWSVASNESLFSIRTGNSSFNMRHFSQASLCKSPELTKFEGLIMNFPPSLSPVTEATEPARDSVNIQRRSDAVESSLETPKAVLNGTRNENVNKEIVQSADAVLEEGKDVPNEGNTSTSEEVISAALPDSDGSFSIQASAVQGPQAEGTKSGKMEEVKAKLEIHKNDVQAAPFATVNINTQCIWFFSCCRLCD